jgi:hypothetical protein
VFKYSSDHSRLAWTRAREKNPAIEEGVCPDGEVRLRLRGSGLPFVRAGLRAEMWLGRFLAEHDCQLDPRCYARPHTRAAHTVRMVFVDSGPLFAPSWEELRRAVLRATLDVRVPTVD